MEYTLKKGDRVRVINNPYQAFGVCNTGEEAVVTKAYPSGSTKLVSLRFLKRKRTVRIFLMHDAEGSPTLEKINA